MYCGVTLEALLQPQLTSNLIVIFPDRASIRPNRLSDGALACELRMLPHIGGDGFLLLAGPVWDSIQVSALLDGLDLRLHLLDQSRQERLTFLPRFGVHIAGVLLSIRPHGGVATLPAVLADLGDAAGAGLPFPSYIGLECGHGPFLLRLRRRFLRSRFSNPLVDLCRRLGPHRAGDVGVDIQRGGR